MNKKETKRKRNISGVKRKKPLPLDKRNYQVFAVGIIILIIGYFFLEQGPWDSFWSRTLAPIVLVFGYCVVIPIAILVRQKKGQRTSQNQSQKV